MYEWNRLHLSIESHISVVGIENFFFLNSPKSNPPHQSHAHHLRIDAQHSKHLFFIYHMVNRRHLLFAVFLFCLGSAFQSQGAFGDPYMQQIAFTGTWLPVVLWALKKYYYRQCGLTKVPVISRRDDTSSAPCNTIASCVGTPTPLLASTQPGLSRI